MALYQDGILISGANTLPQMTLAEYNALPADQRPTYWERLDADYDDVLADKADIATIESGTTASRAYGIGELVYVSGTLYRVKTAIASGATFTVGTNVEVTNVSASITERIASIVKTITIPASTSDAAGIITLTGIPSDAKIILSTANGTVFKQSNNTWGLQTRGQNSQGTPVTNTQFPSFTCYYI